MVDGKESVVVSVGKGRWVVTNKNSHQLEIHRMLLKTFVEKIHAIHELLSSRFPAVSRQEICHSDGIGGAKCVRLVQQLIHFVSITVNCHVNEDNNSLAALLVM